MINNSNNNMYKINKYPDGTSYVDVSNLDPNREIIFRVNTYEDLHHLEQLVEALNYFFKQAPLITLPNLIDAQADRRFKTSQSSGLKIVCKRLNSMNASFRVFHPHNSEVVESLVNEVEIIDNTEFIKKVLTYYLSGEHRFLNDFENSGGILMSSDAGGFKPLMKLCDKIGWEGETFSASKARSWDEKDGTKFVQQIDREDFEGKDILIVDDISVYGGTFKGLSKLLRERNCGKLYLAVSHMTMQNLGADPVTNYFDKVFTTNSKFDNYVSNYTEYVGDKIDPLIYEKIEHNNLPKNLEIIKLFENGN